MRQGDRKGMKWPTILLAVLACLMAAANPLHGQPHTYASPNDIPRGAVCFFTSAQNPRFTTNFGAVAEFNNGDEVHALLNPLMGMTGLPDGQNAFIVQVSVDGAYRMEVEVELPPIGSHQRVIAFPVFPDNRGNKLPRLAAAVKACLESTQGRHRYSITVFLKQDRLYLGTGEFTADRYMGLRQFDAVVDDGGVAAEMQDSAVMAFVVGELGRDFPHLTLVRIEAVNPWHDEPALTGPIKVCTIRYTVRAKDEGCYSGYSELRRVIRKNKGLGRVLGDLWPNERVGCD